MEAKLKFEIFESTLKGSNTQISHLNFSPSTRDDQKKLLQDSAFGLFARRLEARTDNGELMNLIDDSGCPVNELIFPQLDLESSTRALYADFKAFRFPSTPIVNFVATVQFCQELCEPVS